MGKFAMQLASGFVVGLCGLLLFIIVKAAKTPAFSFKTYFGAPLAMSLIPAHAAVAAFVVATHFPVAIILALCAWSEVRFSAVEWITIVVVYVCVGGKPCDDVVEGDEFSCAWNELHGVTVSTVAPVAFYLSSVLCIYDRFAAFGKRYYGHKTGQAYGALHNSTVVPTDELYWKTFFVPHTVLSLLGCRSSLLATTPTKACGNYAGFGCHSCSSKATRPRGWMLTTSDTHYTALAEAI